MAHQLTEADVADIGMALELRAASPDGHAEREALLASLPDASIVLSGWGYLISPDDDT